MLILGGGAAVLEELARITSGGVLAYISSFLNLRFCTFRKLKPFGAGGVPCRGCLISFGGRGLVYIPPALGGGTKAGRCSSLFIVKKSSVKFRANLEIPPNTKDKKEKNFKKGLTNHKFRAIMG